MRDSVLEFIALLRKNGVRVAISEAIESLQALGEIPIVQETAFRSALRSTLVKSNSDIPAFEELFDKHFWGLFKPELRIEIEAQNEGEAGDDAENLSGLSEEAMEALADMEISEMARALLDADADALRMQVHQAAQNFGLERLESQLQQNFYAYGLGQQMGLGEMPAEFDRIRQRLLEGGMSPEAIEDVEAFLQRRLAFLQELVRQAVRNALGKNKIRYREEFRQRSLAEKSFNAMTLEELTEMRLLIQRMAERLKNIMSLRLKRSGKGRLDMPATLRANMKNGGVPFDLRLRKRHRVKPEISVLCDISDSVRYVSRFMLLLVYSLQEVIAKVRSFVFVSDLGETTDLFREYEIEKAIDLAYAGEVINLYSHSNYGYAFEIFFDRYLASINSKTTVMIIGDARNNYFDPNEWVLREIRKRAKEVMWLNPESAISWGLGDSEMTLYRHHCDKVWECRNLKQLEAIISSMLRI